MRLAGKTAVITGAGAGMGRATAELFAEEGARVLALDLVEPEPYASEAIEWRLLDVAELSGWEALAADLEADSGQVDVLVNNAGIVHSWDSITEVDLEDWDRVISVDMNGVFYGMRTMIPLMRERGGSIVNFSSIWGVAGASGVAPYQAAKGAVRTMSKNAAVTYAADGIRVNSIHPGLVMTPLIESQDPELTEIVRQNTPLGRGADPRELAYGVLFLASEESSFMTGAELVIDGGYLAV
jgi:NAD(P)-dependent dehydrogenase (short-subunit alcohol dehydrogenase family)